MMIRFAAVIALFSTCLFSVGLDYVVSPKQHGNVHALEVTLRFQGDESGVSELLLPQSWAGQGHLYREIRNLTAVSDGTVLEDSDRPDVKVVRYEPSQMVGIQYSVVPVTDPGEEWYYRPVVTNEYFSGFGYNLLIVPYMDDQKPTDVSMEWRGFPGDWTIANSLGAGIRKQHVVLSVAKLLNSVFVGGDFRLHTCGNDDAPITVAIRGSWSFPDTWFVDHVSKVITMQRSFWDDNGFPYFLVTVLPTGNGFSMGGTAVSNAFSLFMGNINPDNEEDKNWLLWLVSHEHFHTWNGLKMTSSPDDSSMYWFSEGFTDYFAGKLLYTSGLFAKQNFVDYVNYVLYEYFFSSAHHVDNEEVRLNFWNDYDVQKLPYQRGFLLAMRWDMRIQTLSKGQQSLDSFMKALYQQSSKGTYTQDDIIRIASEFLPSEEVVNDLSKYILEGKSLVPPCEYFADSYALQWSQAPGFLLHHTKKKGIISGVRSASSAYEAGLRNGQLFVGYEAKGDEVVVSIRDKSGEIKKISYVNKQSVKAIPQYKQE